MNTASGSSAAAIPSIKKFVSETEIEEKRQKRQEEWEKVRQPNQPLEAPEEPVENRSLYEQLQAQKDLKQLEFDEAHKLKNQVHGLDKEEAEFLDYVTERQQEVEKERHLEELEVLQEFRNSVSNRTTVIESSSSKQTDNKPFNAATKQTTKKRSSQAELLAKAVKRKRPDEDSAEKTTLSNSGDEPLDQVSISPAGSNPSSVTSTANQSTTSSTNSEEPAPAASAGTGGIARVIGVLPGLGVYTDSEQSDSSSSDSEIDTDVFRRDLNSRLNQESGGQRR